MVGAATEVDALDSTSQLGHYTAPPTEGEYAHIRTSGYLVDSTTSSSNAWLSRTWNIQPAHYRPIPEWDFRAVCEGLRAGVGSGGGPRGAVS